MFRALRLENGAIQAGGLELGESGGRLWLDLTPEAEHLEWLRSHFGLHALALEDCLNEDQRPKYEEYPEAIFCVLHRLGPSPDESGLQARELHAFLTGEALITVHRAPIAEIDRVFDRCGANVADLGRGPDLVLWQIFDAITDVHFDVANALTDEIEELANEVSGGTSNGDVVNRILAARRTHALLRRRLAPQREVFASLARAGGRVSERAALYFRDVQDHVLRVTEEIDVGRDLLGSVMDVHLSLVNNRLNQITTRLTVIASIFLPLNFLVGFFGMNLEILPASVAKTIVLIVILSLPPLGLFYFRRKGML
jgi:magnesium transporter